MPSLVLSLSVKYVLNKSVSISVICMNFLIVEERKTHLVRVQVKKKYIFPISMLLSSKKTFQIEEDKF